MVSVNKGNITTEEKIMLAAVKVFTEKGMAGARMQDIADEAQVNKAMVHYYYRSKQQLFETIFKSKIQELFSAFGAILQGNLTFENKIRAFVKTEIEMLSQFPAIPLFVLNEAGKNPAVLDEVFINGGPRQLKELFRDLVEKEMAAGTIRPVPFEQLLINVMALCIYPFVARPILQFVLDKDNASFEEMIEKRKEEVADLILGDLLIKPA